MEIDHIFIFSNQGGVEANDLIDFGFTEGSNRRHHGQGTINRKFYFDNFFLEILWVIDEEEIKNTTTAVTKLWERSQFQNNTYSRFGLCFVNTAETDSLFEDSRTYSPAYFPKGMSINMIVNENNPQLPCTFRLPYRGRKNNHNEPIKHKNGIKTLTRAEFEIPEYSIKNSLIKNFYEFDHIKYTSSNRIHLTLEFDHNHKGKKKIFETLNLTLKY